MGQARNNEIYRMYKNELGEAIIYQFNDDPKWVLSVSSDKAEISIWIPFKFKQQAIDLFQFYMGWLDKNQFYLGLCKEGETI